jgi:hypothetical protein
MVEVILRCLPDATDLIHFMVESSIPARGEGEREREREGGGREGERGKGGST